MYFDEGQDKGVHFFAVGEIGDPPVGVGVVLVQHLSGSNFALKGTAIFIPNPLVGRSMGLAVVVLGIHHHGQNGYS